MEFLRVPSAAVLILFAAAAGKSPKRRRWRMQRGDFEEVPRLAAMIVAADRMARRCYPGGTAGFSQKAWELRVPSAAVLIFFSAPARAGIISAHLLCHAALGRLFRALAAEIQALGCATPFPYPKRTARGIDISRLQLLLAVLERRCGILSRTSDIYLNVAGGLQLKDPAADLGICASLASAVTDIELPSDVCFIGEVGLAGEVRPAGRTLMLGFKRAVISRRTPKESYPIDVLKISSLREIVDLFLKR